MGGKRKREPTPQDDLETAFYLMKTEPHVFSIDDLEKANDQTSGWEGVRNYTARNILESMPLHAKAFCYHSSCKVPGIVGIMEVVRTAYEDASVYDPKHVNYVEKLAEDREKPNPWRMVDVKLVRKLKRIITLQELKSLKGKAESDGGSKAEESPLENMVLLRQGRLSVQRVTPAEWEYILSLEE